MRVRSHDGHTLELADLNHRPVPVAQSVTPPGSSSLRVDNGAESFVTARPPGHCAGTRCLRVPD
jgi:hypothetical protein